jgi:hypothetical protein
MLYFMFYTLPYLPARSGSRRFGFREPPAPISENSIESASAASFNKRKKINLWSILLTLNGVSQADTV